MSNVSYYEWFKKITPLYMSRIDAVNRKEVAMLVEIYNKRWRLWDDKVK